MILIAHIIIALSSLIVAALAYFKPSRKKLSLSYSLIALTFGSGLILIFSGSVHMLTVCLEGLIYLAVVSFGLVKAHHKLSAQEAKE
jgi:hypothetical protein